MFEKPQKELTSHIINESAESKRITLRTFIISLVVSLTITLLASAFSLFLSNKASRDNEEQIQEIIKSELSSLGNKVPAVSFDYTDLNFSPKLNECVQGASDLLKSLNSSDIEPMENGASGVKDNNRIFLTCSNNRLLSYITGAETTNVNSLQDEIRALLPMCLPLTEDFEDFNHEERWIITKNATVGETKSGNSQDNSKYLTFSGDDERSIRTQKFHSSDWVTISFDLIIVVGAHTNGL